MASFSHVTVLGYVGNDVELRSGTGKNVNYLQLSISVTKTYKKDRLGKEWSTRTHWIKVMLYGPTAVNTASRIHKGDLIHITGELHVSERTVEGKKTYEMYVLGSHILPIKVKNKQKIDHNYGVAEDEIEDNDVVF